MLRNHGLIFREGKTAWTKTHRWLSQLRNELDGPLHTALAAELEHLEYLEMQRNAFDTEVERFAQAPPYRTQVEALCCLRGVKTLTAMTLLSEIGDIHRFKSPRALMGYFGLVFREHSSGERERRGPITKTGNTHARRVLTEAAWNNRHKGGADLILNRRRQGQPADVVAIAIKAQHRLHKKFWRLDHRIKYALRAFALTRETRQRQLRTNTCECVNPSGPLPEGTTRTI
jgi:transposase